MCISKIYAGIDIGSVSIKVVLVAQKEIIASGLISSGGNYKEAAKGLLEQVLSDAGTSTGSLSGMVATGVGADSAPFAERQVSDISCHAKGCYSIFPSARTIIDIGGQFTKVARITPQGRLIDFLISEKCATGSGRFLQIIARILHVRVEDIGLLSLQSQSPVEFSTNCAVFAESETISRIAEGASKADILAGVHRAMASKAAMLVQRLTLEPDVVLTGGGGGDAGLIEALSRVLNNKVLVPEQPRLTAAIGAAYLAEEESE